MTALTSTRPTFEERQQAYVARLVEIGSAAADPIREPHAKDFSADFIDWRPGSRMTAHCKCGRTFRSSQARGLHLAAIQRKADSAWDEAIASHRAELDAILSGGAR